MIFIDFKAAFNSVTRDANWQVAELHGLPNKILNIIRNMYHDPVRISRKNNLLSYPFALKCGVEQGGYPVPFLFADLLDTQIKTTAGSPYEIELDTLMCDLDYVEGICRLGDKKPRAKEEVAGEVGLKNVGRTKCMFSNT